MVKRWSMLSCAVRMSRRCAVLGVGWLLASLSVAHPAFADTPAAKRPLPDYGGAPDTPSLADELWVVPRIVLSPLYLVSEYVVRRPLEFLVSEAERKHLPEALYNFFVFGPDHSAGLLPIAFVDFGFYPSIGAYFFWKNFVPGQDLRVRGSFWGDRWLAGTISDSIHLDPRTTLILQAEGLRRPDNLFYGLGPDSVDDDRGRFGASRLSTSAALQIQLGEYSHLTSGLGVRRVSFHRGHYGQDSPIERVAERGGYTLPTAYVEGDYTLLFDQLALAFDTRHARPAPQSGVRVEAHVEHLSVLQPEAAGVLRYGANLGGFWDVRGSGRVLSLAFSSTFADPLRRGFDIPFTELSTIGGNDMRGFQPGRLYGRSAAIATLHYRWPVWVWLDGSIQLSVGNVFDEHLSDFSLPRLRFSGSIGVESAGAPDSSLELLFGVGSETFRHGGQITSLRLSVGSNHGF